MKHDPNELITVSNSQVNRSGTCNYSELPCHICGGKVTIMSADFCSDKDLCWCNDCGWKNWVVPE